MYFLQLYPRQQPLSEVVLAQTGATWLMLALQDAMLHWYPWHSASIYSNNMTLALISAHHCF